MARYKLPIPSIAGTLVLTTAGAAQAQPSTQPPTEAAPATAGEGASTPETATAVPEPPTSTAAPTMAESPAPDPEPVAPATSPQPAPLENPFTPEAEEAAPRVAIEPKAAPEGRAIKIIPRSSNRSYFEANAGSLHTMFGFSSPYGGSSAQLEQVFGRYVGRSKTDGLGLGFVAIERLSSLYNDYTVGMRFQWDKPISEDLGIYINHGLTVGFNIITDGYYGGVYPLAFGFDLAYGAGAKILIKDRLSLTFRPVNLDFTGPLLWRLRWSVLAGFGIHW